MFTVGAQWIAQVDTTVVGVEGTTIPFSCREARGQVCVLFQKEIPNDTVQWCFWKSPLNWKSEAWCRACCKETKEILEDIEFTSLSSLAPESHWVAQFARFAPPFDRLLKLSSFKNIHCCFLCFLCFPFFLSSVHLRLGFWRSLCGSAQARLWKFGKAGRANCKQLVLNNSLCSLVSVKLPKTLTDWLATAFGHPSFVIEGLEDYVFWITTRQRGDCPEFVEIVLDSLAVHKSVKHAKCGLPNQAVVLLCEEFINAFWVPESLA